MAARPALKEAERPMAVVVEDLHKRFGELEVLKGVSLEAREGDVVSMIGASGSGKSTFCAASIFWKCRPRAALW